MKQGGSSQGSQRRLLSCSHGQAVIALIAAVAINIVPLDLVLTDGNGYVIWRFLGKQLLKYENLTAREVGAKAFVTASHCTAPDSVLC